MKKIFWYIYGKEIMFNVNWLEFVVLKNIFKKKKYQIKKIELRGKKIDLLVCDEIGVIPKPL